MIPQSHTRLVDAILKEDLPFVAENDPENHWVTAELLILNSTGPSKETVIERTERLMLVAMRKKKQRLLEAQKK